MKDKEEEKYSGNTESEEGHKDEKQPMTWHFDEDPERRMTEDKHPMHSHFDEEQKGRETSCEFTVS